MNLLRLKGRMADLEAQEFDSQVKDVEREILCAIDDFEEAIRKLVADNVLPLITIDEEHLAKAYRTFFTLACRYAHSNGSLQIKNFIMKSEALDKAIEKFCGLKLNNKVI